MKHFSINHISVFLQVKTLLMNYKQNTFTFIIWDVKWCNKHKRVQQSKTSVYWENHLKYQNLHLLTVISKKLSQN